MVEIGNRLKERREELGFTLKEMSDKTRVPVYKLQAIENGDLKFFDNEKNTLTFCFYFAFILRTNLNTIKTYRKI